MIKLILGMLILIFCSSSLASEKGKKLYGLCIQCHGKQGMGLVARQAPKIAGQFSWYSQKRLLEFRDKVKNSKMTPFVKDLTNEQLEQLSIYVETL